MLQQAGSRGGDTGGPGDGLARLLALPGADYACAVDAEGHPLEQVGDDAGPADAVIEWGRRTAAVSAARERELDDLMVTSTSAYHVVRRCPVHDGGNAWVYVRVARDRGNLALTRRSLAALTLDGRRSGGPMVLPAPRRAEPARPGPGPALPGIAAGGRGAEPGPRRTEPALPVPRPAVPAALVAVPSVPPPPPAPAEDPAGPRRPGALVEVHTVPPPPPPVPADAQQVPVPAPASEVAAPSRPAALTEVPTVPPPPPATPGTSPEPSVPAPRTPPVLPNRLAPARLATLEAIPAPAPAAGSPETTREATTSVAPTSEAPTSVAPAGAEASVADAPHPSPDGRAVPAAVPSVLPQQWSTDQSTLARLLAGLRGLTSRPSTHQAPRRGARPA